VSKTKLPPKNAGDDDDAGGRHSDHGDDQADCARDRARVEEVIGEGLPGEAVHHCESMAMSKAVELSRSERPGCGVRTAVA
jgi:hypothetical protein